MRAILCAVGVFVLSGAGMLAGTASADAPVTLTLSASEIALSPGDSAEVLLTLTNNGGASFPLTLRSVVSSSSVEAKLRASTLDLAQGQSRSVDVAVQRVGEGVGQDVTVSFVAETPEMSVVASLVVKAVPNPAVVAVKVDSVVDRVNENRPGSAMLVVDNAREADARVSSVDVTAPASVAVVLTCPDGTEVQAADGNTSRKDCAFVVPARDQVILPVTVTTTDSISPGPRSATFRVRAQPQNGPGGTVSVVASMGFAVEVFAESDLLDALGVPVFLLLPGVVIVLTVWLLVARFTPWPTKERPPVGTVGTVAGTAVIGLGVSLLMAYVYPVMTSWFMPGTRRDYTKAYGFLDFYYVFFHSLVIAIAIWVLALAAYRVRVGYHWLFVPKAGDEPTALLRKMAFLGRFGTTTTLLPKVTVGGAGGVVLRRATTALVAPRIVVSIPGTDRNLVDAAEKAVTDGDGWRLWHIARSTGVTPHFFGSDLDAVREVADCPDGGQDVPLVRLEIEEPRKELEEPQKELVAEP